MTTLTAARTKPLRCLIVDDSATMRAVVARLLSFDPAIQVVGQASDPMQARTMIKELDPDVLTLDVEMPGMNGLDFLEKIMTLRPMPVVMVSTLTTRGAEASLRALELGAFDCYAKPSNIREGDNGALAAIVRAATNSRPRTIRPAAAVVSPVRPVPTNYRPRPGAMIAIGASTGGVEALLAVLSQMPANCPPTMIVQHLPSLFTASFASRLDRSCAPTVVEAESGMVLQTGHVYLAPGGATHMEALGGRLPRLRLFAGDTVSGHRPSVDVLFRSVAKFGAGQVGILLTGMGQDGAHGLLDMRNAGARTIGQDEATSVVYGMPGVAHNIGAVEYQLPLDRVAGRALELTRL
ncbi:MAG TPA: chemotaxis response regulator protein-glutamate methylesterase [Sphingomonas sp.]|uniref:protein-glutamate methylesterase/protein-glutamine glutaminase n=1 Tax=Sphingomonas sp. TaxID=28214 RepID=UPI002ED83CC0